MCTDGGDRLTNQASQHLGLPSNPFCNHRLIVRSFRQDGRIEMQPDMVPAGSYLL